TARNPAFDARIEDSRAENQEEPLSDADGATFLRRRCPGFHHWRDLARSASANLFRFIAFDWISSCVKAQRAIAEESGATVRSVALTVDEGRKGTCDKTRK